MSVLKLDRPTERRIMLGMFAFILALLSVIVIHMHQDVTYYQVRNGKHHHAMCSHSNVGSRG